MRHKAIIFDLYGTLIDNFSIKEYSNMLSDMSRILGIEPGEFIKEWLDSFEIRMLGRLKGPEENIEYICNKKGKKPDRKQIKEAVKIRFHFNGDTIKPRKNYIRTLNRLIELGYKLGLISDCSYETVRSWRKSKLCKILSCAIFSSEIGIKKPDIRIYQIACERLNVKPEQCIYVGDGCSNELTGAANAGMTPIKIQVPYEIKDDTYKIGEDKLECRTIKNINELLNLESILG